MAVARARVKKQRPPKAASAAEGLTIVQRQRFNALLALEPATLSQALDQFASGYLRPAAELWDKMCERDDILLSVKPKREDSIAQRNWEILMLDNLSPAEERRAERHVEVLKDFYNNLTATCIWDRNIQGGMSRLVSQMMEAVSYRYAAHHIIWQPSVGGLTATFERVPIWLMDNQTGRLQYTRGEVGGGEPIKPDEWMVTVGKGLMICGSIGYTYKHLAQRDLLAYSDKFAMPGVLGKTTAARGSEQGRAMREAVAAFGHDWASVIYGSDGSESISLIEPRGAASSLPMPMIIDRVDRGLATIYRGGDLSTISSQREGRGASLQGDETDLIEIADAAMVSETFNTQIDRRVIKYATGDDRPLAYIKISVPPKEDTLLNIRTDRFLIDMGVRISKASLAERYGRTEAADDEEVAALLSSASGAASDELAYNERPAGRAVGDDPDIGLFLARARDLYAGAISADLRPLGAAITKAIAASEADTTEALELLNAALPEIADEVFGGRQSDEALEQIISAALVSGLADETKAANANPYRKRNGRFGSKSDYDYLVGREGSWEEMELPAATDLPAKPAPAHRETQAAAIARLQRGESTTDPMGRSVTFGGVASQHMLGKTDSDPRRAGFLATALDTVTDPLEVWQVTTGKESGRLYYISRYDHPDKRKGGFMVVTLPPQSSQAEVLTYMPRKVRELNAKRRGKLLHVGYGGDDKGG